MFFVFFFAYSGVQHIWCCLFVLFFVFVLVPHKKTQDEDKNSTTQYVLDTTNKKTQDEDKNNTTQYVLDTTNKKTQDEDKNNTTQYVLDTTNNHS
jgi:hypothetical protein